MASVRLSRSQRFFKNLSLVLLSGSVPLLLWAALRRPPGSDRSPLPVLDLLPPDYAADLPACSAIIQGDLEGLERKQLSVLLKTMKKQQLLSEAFYHNVTQDCQRYVTEREFITVPLSQEEKEFPIAYSMVIHDKIEMFERLLRALYTPQNVYCVHIDQKSSEAFRTAVRAIVSCLTNVFVASKLESVVYASWSRVQADLNCMEDLLKSPVQWRYLINTCGTDFPIKTNAEMVQALKLQNGRNSMESETTDDYKNSRWQFHHKITSNMVVKTNVRKSPPPISTPMFSGNAYFLVSRAFVRHVMKSQEVRALLEWEKDTYSPDEHLWATLQRMPSVPGSNPPHIKYHESDMNAIARIVKWRSLEGDVRNGAPYPPCSGVYRRSICVYGAGDLRWLLQHHHLIANKFDPEVDDVAIRCLESYLRFKATDRVSRRTVESERILQKQ
ncbi:beta-1,3-galactosyl-O-glycosyl-glycoprotein beta-1,6-N-acetylglucosaminyltransferase 3-like [Oncorhynchus mykiss]|uniref:Beta-1,3-galactosyl-O-glycosyl-glycoprotein beta-1,6-N-acetylglucosaminyltransferase 3 n=1 Tax=Oncorhynchus mykiss TaxID=8022 RepID=A0A8K9UDS0_ONCMY|nr:beta-1,3-galactosyl-O-glycosyl-glycoprotein beta-1,6-N-acetylglucosaminyltransferase 3-like [Oncorhynchus mykiss]